MEVFYNKIVGRRIGVRIHCNDQSLSALNMIIIFFVGREFSEKLEYC